MQKRFLKFLTVSLLLIFGLMFFVMRENPNLLSPKDKPNLQLHFLDVGQGDAILIQTPGQKDILIDGGPDSEVINQLGKVMPFYDREIDIMILTHSHADHAVGLISVLERFEVKEIYYSGAPDESQEFAEWLNAVENENARFIIIKEHQTLEIEPGLSLEFLYPRHDITDERPENLNNTSIVSRLHYGETEVLFMGDAEIETEDELLQADMDLSADLIKIGHHGSDSSSSKEFLEAVQPRLAVIQCGKENSFGHPSLLTLRRIESAGTYILRNDQHGLISFVSDGRTLEQQD